MKRGREGVGGSPQGGGGINTCIESYYKFLAEGSILPQGIFVGFSIDVSFIAHILIHSNAGVHDARQIFGLNTSVPSEFVKEK
jgi:hypothetical protein